MYHVEKQRELRELARGAFAMGMDSRRKRAGGEAGVEYSEAADPEIRLLVTITR